ncbi:MAG: hypothetical protein GVY24_02760 [Planctomycetes bacterium]|jgi:predicted phosphodiesterase|nr:hypothetical protein [Planctomycetota bacterium]
MNRRCRTVILSDTHLGKTHGGARSVEMLRPLLEGADHLIINGDVAEGVYPHLREDAEVQVALLREVCDRRGVELTLLAGNHDPLISPLRSLDLAGGQVHVTHGDRIHPAISPWAGRRRHQRELQWRQVRQDAEAADLWSVAASSPSREAAHLALHERFDAQVSPPINPRGPRRAWDIAHQAMWATYYWYVMPRLAARHAVEVAPDSRFFIFGHIHRSGVWRDGPRTLINTGSFGIPGRPHGVVLEGQRLFVRRITRRDGAWRWCTTESARFDLTPAAEQPPAEQAGENSPRRRVA